MYLHLVFNKSAYRSLLYIDIILVVKTIFNNSFSSRISGYPASRVSGRIPDIKKAGIHISHFLMKVRLAISYDDRSLGKKKFCSFHTTPARGTVGLSRIY